MKGFNAKTRQVEDLDLAHIVDPANIILNSCKNAISVAASALTASSAVLLPRDDAPQLIDPRMLMR